MPTPISASSSRPRCPPRGFDLSWVPELSDPTRVFMSMLMFIGGGSSSTAGGIRVTTLAVLVLTCRAALTGHNDVTAFRRRLPARVVMMAVSVTLIFALLTFIASLALMFVTDRPLSDVLFEVCSALSLGGYSVGVANAQRLDDARANVPPGLRQPEEREQAWQGGHAHVEAHVQQPVGGVRIGTDQEAAAIARADLEGKDMRGETAGLSAVKARRTGKSLLCLGENLEAGRHEERLSLL